MGAQYSATTPVWRRTVVTDMSILGRVGALLRSELTARLSVRRWVAGARRRRDRWSDATRDRGRRVGDDTSARPEAAAARHQGVPTQDPELTRYYANLELPYGADIEAVRGARRRLLKRYHPDLHSADAERRRTATELAQGLNHAHDELVRRLDRK